MASYPSSVVALSTKNDGDTVFSSHVDALQDEIIAVENGLLSGIAHNLVPDANNTRDLGSAAKAWANLFTTNLKVNGIFLQVPLVQTTTLTGTQNDFALTTPANVLTLRCNNAADVTFTGFVAGTDGQVLIIESIGAGNVFVKHQNAGSAAANRAINFATSGDTPGAAGTGMFVYVYDGATARWRLVQHEQGAWITPAFNATHYTGNVATWTVDPGDVGNLGYYLRGRTLTVGLNISATSTGAGTSTALIIANGQWGGFTVAKATGGSYMANDVGAGFQAGTWQVSTTTLSMFRAANAAWGAAANTTGMLCTAIFEVT